MRTEWNVYTKSILFFPVLFAIAAFILFMITSIADNSFPTGYSLDTEYLDPLIFTGSPGAARSILSAIATGWATIFGVAFSVTLITLQLSVSKYISHLVNRFEGDRINQLSLGWFMFTVIFSLLVLKTVRTGESSINLATMMNTSSLALSGNPEVEISVFTPIIGVNVAIILAVVGLFMLILYLHNISSYLKPNILISKLITQILDSLKPYEKRTPNESSDDNIKADSKIFEINSSRKGMLSYIDWNKISETLSDVASQKQKSLWMEYYKSIGDWIEENDNIAIVYEYDNSQKHKSKKEYSTEHMEQWNIENNQDNKDHIKNIEQKFLQNIEISDDRDLARDPLFGIEVLRSVAVKSADLGDTDVIKSCITGLFRILHYAFVHKETIGIPFTITTEATKKKIDKIPLQEKQSNDIDKINNDRYNTHENKQQIPQPSVLESIIKPKEILLDNIILVELSTIIDKILTTRDVPIIYHIVSEYIAQCKNLIREDKREEFAMLTDWCTGQISLALKSFPQHLCIIIIDQLLSFRKDLDHYHIYFGKIFQMHMKDIVSVSHK